ncbi:choice-of-anchor Q domain-containing protein [Raineya sp.]|jgi:hypothetical protein
MKRLCYFAFFLCVLACKKKSSNEPNPTNNTPQAVCEAPPLADMTGASLWGDGTPASCTQTKLQELLDAGGKIKCNCGDAPFSLSLTSSLIIPNKEIVIDGGNKVTLNGNNQHIIMDKAPAANQNAGTLLVVQNLRFINAKGNKGERGAAIRGRAFGSLKVFNCVFENNNMPIPDADDCGAVHTILYKEAIFANCTFRNNKAPNGAAVGTIGTAMTFINCVFENNEATGTGGTFAQGGQGGAVYVDGIDQNGVNNQMSMCGCTFINNKANHQAGAVNVIFYAGKGSSMSMDKCSFENNSCRDDKGGGFYFMNGSLNLSNTLFSKNSSPSQGGGLWVANGTLNITNCTFEGNLAVNGTNGLGGAFALSSGTCNIMNCTFAQNRAGDFASAIFNGGNTTLANTLFYNNLVGGTNQGNPYGGAVINKNSNLTVGEGNMQFPKSFSGQFGATDDYWLTPSVSTEDAGLLPLADNGGFTKTMALPQGSPAIDRGTNQNAPSTDQRGLPRKNKPDCGAFEFQ